MTQAMKEKLFNDVIKADEDLDMAIGTDNENGAIEKVANLMKIVADFNLEDEFEQYACEMNDIF